MCYTKAKRGGKLSLVRGIKQNYRVITEPLINVKSAFIAICADIDRYIRLRVGCEIREEMDDQSVDKLKGLFPYLSQLNTDQWNRLVHVFLNIRNDNAHLYQNKPVFIDRDLLLYLNGLVEPEMTTVVNGNELTLYGAYYVIVFLSQKFQLWAFITSFLREQNLIDKDKKEFHAFQAASQHLLQRYCGIGKPIGNTDGKSMTELTFINDTLRRELTSVFLGLEDIAIDRDNSAQYSPSFRAVLGNISPVADDNKLFDRLIELRNIWFHGHWLGDVVTLPNGDKKKFDLYDTIETLKMLEEALIENEEYDPVTSQIESFGKALLDFKALRLVEVSYKLLDSRLLTKEKLDERVINLENAFYVMTSTEDRYFIAASSLIFDGPISWKVSAAKFSNADYLPRKTDVDELKVIVLESESGFDIGGFHTPVKTLTLCDISLPDEFSLMVNGRKLSDYPITLVRDICPRIKIYKAKM